MVSHWLVGAARSVFTGRSVFRSGLDMFVVGLGVAVVGYFVGEWIARFSDEPSGAAALTVSPASASDDSSSPAALRPSLRRLSTRALALAAQVVRAPRRRQAPTVQTMPRRRSIGCGRPASAIPAGRLRRTITQPASTLDAAGGVAVRRAQPLRAARRSARISTSGRIRTRRTRATARHGWRSSSQRRCITAPRSARRGPYRAPAASGLYHVTDERQHAPASTSARASTIPLTGLSHADAAARRARPGTDARAAAAVGTKF